MDAGTKLRTADSFERVQEALSFGARALGEFESSEEGLARRPARESTALDRSSRTGTAFSVFLFSQSGLVETHLQPEAREKISSYIKGVVLEKVGALPGWEQTEGSETEKLPDDTLNEYSVPIWTSGVLSACLFDKSVATATKESPRFTEAISSLAEELKKASGSLRRVGVASSERIPSAYLTYWATCSLLSARQFFPLDALSVKIDDALSFVAQWSELELSRLIANHHAGLPSRFDVVECVSCACTVARLGHAQSPWVLDEATRLSIYSIGLVLDEYFESGSFKLSRPVFSDIKHNAILCPTSEALFMILSSFSRQNKAEILNQNRVNKLNDAFEWCLRNRQNGAYPPDYDVSLGGGASANVFSTASSLCFFKFFAEFLDDTLDDHAREALDVPVIDQKQPILRDYPSPFREAIKSKVIHPLKINQRRLAKYSMILHGPPGTAKTTLARKIAFDLGWPLKIITQSDFLRLGKDKIDSEAERVFSLCTQLRNVVLLFDELEELILARENAIGDDGTPLATDRDSRLLTASMLPIIHELRDRRRSVFIFATNRLTQIDEAATRLGRFDIIYFVGYPAKQELTSASLGFLKARLSDLPNTEAGERGRVEVERVQESVSEDKLFSKLSAVERKHPLLTYSDIIYVCEKMLWESSNYNKTASELTATGSNLVVKLDNQNRVDSEKYASLKAKDRL